MTLARAPPQTNARLTPLIKTEARSNAVLFAAAREDSVPLPAGSSTSLPVASSFVMGLDACLLSFASTNVANAGGLNPPPSTPTIASSTNSNNSSLLVAASGADTLRESFMLLSYDPISTDDVNLASGLSPLLLPTFHEMTEMETVSCNRGWFLSSLLIDDVIVAPLTNAHIPVMDAREEMFSPEANPELGKASFPPSRPPLPTTSY